MPSSTIYLILFCLFLILCSSGGISGSRLPDSLPEKYKLDGSLTNSLSSTQNQLLEKLILCAAVAGRGEEAKEVLEQVIHSEKRESFTYGIVLTLTAAGILGICAAMLIKKINRPSNGRQSMDNALIPKGQVVRDFTCHKFGSEMGA